ncbi:MULTISPECIES: tetratricopeptide repeat protein [unclassified Microcoleus]|uniref:tetratricopeptide repeat protein n=1 Tax=unclassified Microcoleus TaxID=2642155 RepID=UPI002FD799B2
MASLKLSAEGFQILERARRQKRWDKSAEVLCSDALTSKATLRRFWAKQPIQHDTFIRICQTLGIENWEAVVDRTPENPLPHNQAVPHSHLATEKAQIPHPLSFTLPEKLPPVRNFAGRIQELETIKNQLLDPNTRAITITSVCVVGLAGIGKTTLTSQLVRQLQSDNTQFVAVAWESLRSATGVAPGFDWIVDSLLSALSRRPISTAAVRDDYLKKTEKLIELLKKQPCLIVLDNVETVLQTGKADRAGYFAASCPEYAWLLQQLAETEHQSKVIFTCRETLAELPHRATKTISLTGLDIDAAVTLLQSFELLATQSELAALAESYQGHPKALEMIAALIRDDSEFQGKVERFLRDRNWLLIRDIENLIDEVFNRLSEQEQTCLRRISIYQTSEYPLTFAGISAQMPEVSEYDLKENVIQALKRRQFLDYDRQRESYQLHPLIQEKAYRLLCQNPEHFRTANQQAYRYFLNIPLKPKTEWKSIRDIKPLLLAHYYACQAEDWDEAAIAISDACDSLRYWSHFKRLIYLYSKLIPVDWKQGGKLVNDTATHIDVLCQLGLSYQSIEQFEIASEYLDRGLSVSREIENKKAEGMALFYIARGHQYLENYQNAIKYLQDCLAIAIEIKEDKIEFKVLNTLGYLNFYRGKYELAIASYTEALKVARQNSFLEGEANAFAALGNIHIGLKKYDLAIDYFKQYIAIMSDKQQQIKCTTYLHTELSNFCANIHKYKMVISLVQESVESYTNGVQKYDSIYQIEGLLTANNGLKEYQIFFDILSECIKLESDGDARNKAEWVYKLGEKFHKLREFVQAIEDIQSSETLHNIDGKVGTESVETFKVLIELVKTLLRCGISIQRMIQYYLNQAEQICKEQQLPLLTQIQEIQADLQEN